MTNWRAMQVPLDPKTKQPLVPHGIRTRYMAMASWRRNGGGKTGTKS